MRSKVTSIFFGLMPFLLSAYTTDWNWRIEIGEPIELSVPLLEDSDSMYYGHNIEPFIIGSMGGFHPAMMPQWLAFSLWQDVPSN